MMTTTSNGAIELQLDESTGIATLTLKMEGSVNKINSQFGAGLTEALSWAQAQPGLKGIIVGSGHRDFCAGADIDAMFRERDPAVFYERVRRLQTLFRQLETCGVPVVAALTGSALGGGCELALACHRRIALDDGRIQLGLPEVSLGLLPGAGGTQRLTRLRGFQVAFELILQGKLLRPAKAKAVGLVDELQPSPEAVHRAAAQWIAEHPDAKQPWDLPGYRFPGPEPSSSGARELLLVSAGLLYQKTAGAYLAPQLAMRAIYEGSGLTFDRSMEVEARYFVKLATGDQAKDMVRTLWYHRTAAEKQKDLPQVAEAGLNKIGILGAGMMGAGLAWVCANVGYQVVLKDIKPEVLEAARRHCEKLTAERARHLGEAEKQALLGRIHTSLEPQDLAGCDLVIEAVFENLELKQQVTRESEPLLAEGGFWASNTSALPISELAKASRQPERFIGLHFFSPVEQMPLLEIVKGEQTNEQTVARALAFCRKIKKTPILVNDGYGFFTTRVFSSYLLEGAQLVLEGHQPALIEWAARSAGMAIGPLQVFDEVSLSLVRHAMGQREKYLGRLELPAVQLLKRMVDDLHRPGRAGGAGFYEYQAGKRVGLWPGLRELAQGTPAAEETGCERLGRRLLLVQCAEVARVLEAGVLQRPRDAEVGAVFGLGFAPNTGGPLSYMDRLGLPTVVSELQALAQRHGPRYAPAPLLLKMAEKGETFFEPV